VLRSWRVLDRSWRVLDRSWRVFDRSWRVFRAFSAFGGSRSGRGSICSIATTTGCHSYGTLMILDTGHNETWMAGPRLRFSTNTPNIPVCSISHQLLYCHLYCSPGVTRPFLIFSFFPHPPQLKPKPTFAPRKIIFPRRRARNNKTNPPQFDRTLRAPSTGQLWMFLGGSISFCHLLYMCIAVTLTTHGGRPARARQSSAPARASLGERSAGETGDTCPESVGIARSKCTA
jgi:hypothetical protein